MEVKIKKSLTNLFKLTKKLIKKLRMMKLLYLKSKFWIIIFYRYTLLKKIFEEMDPIL